MFYSIRDEFIYNPFQLYLTADKFRASDFVHRDTGHCIDKANLLIACARYHGIPARYRFTNVRNHLMGEKMARVLKTDIIIFHGLAELFLGGRWLKVVPAFNKALCEKLQVEALEFDGSKDAIFQQNDVEGRQFMEYLYDHGAFATLPFTLLIDTVFHHYPHLRTDSPLLNS